MKIQNVAFLAMAACLICSGCGRKIDASSKEKFNSSIEAIEKSMSAEEVLEFRRYCAAIFFDNLDKGKEAYKVLDGMTFQDVKAKAKAIIEQHEKREKEHRQEEIAELRERISELDETIRQNAANRIQLRKIIITNASFQKVKDEFLEEPIISFSIHNTSDKTISRIFCQAVLTSTGRRVPWIEDKFNYAFRGGLNAGEKQNLNLRANSFSEWGELSNRDDYTLTLTLLGAEDENKESLWKIEDGVEKEKAECEKELKKLLSEQDKQ